CARVTANYVRGLDSW
nr:immunoglobulin heavy chain junction region [Macaca mulatta]MOV44484.1 immunoglobulin heavy chain junction region [Macaca mulatta]